MRYEKGLPFNVGRFFKNELHKFLTVYWEQCAILVEQRADKTPIEHYIKD